MTPPPGTTSDPEVLVVGAGPTGLVLALDLARRGVPFRLVDKSLAPSSTSKALGIHARTLEVLGTMGLAETFVAAGFRSGGVRLFVRGREVASGKLEGLAEHGTPYPYILVLSQAKTEAFLTAALRERGVAVERGVEVLSVTEGEEAVLTRLRSADGSESMVRSAYVVGCDGAHSVVRKALEIPFVGEAYAQRFLLADVDVDWDLSHDTFTLFFGPKGVCAYFPIDGKKHGRFVIVDHVTDSDDAPTLDGIREAVRYYAERDVRLSNPAWLTRFRLHHRCAARYGRGRVFLAGDAAHIHSPAGGQGMNTGIQDAYNLGWKLAAVLRQRAAPTLLDSYDAERHPVGEHLVRRTDRLFTFLSTGNRFVSHVRNAVAPLVAPLVMNDPGRRDRAFHFVSQLGVRYLRSPIVGEARGGLGVDAVPGPRAGTRAPDVSLREGTTLFDAFRDGGFHWLALGTDDANDGAHVLAAARDAFDSACPGMPVARHDLRGIPDATRRYAATAPCSVLVRPDGYVAFKATGTSAVPCAEHLARMFRGRPTVDAR